ncbi:MAG: hypothetical protein AAF747_05330 [Planctomycetota bacterium]
MSAALGTCKARGEWQRFEAETTALAAGVRAFAKGDEAECRESYTGCKACDPRPQRDREAQQAGDRERDDDGTVAAEAAS